MSDYERMLHLIHNIKYKIKIKIKMKIKINETKIKFKGNVVKFPTNENIFYGRG